MSRFFSILALSGCLAAPLAGPAFAQDTMQKSATAMSHDAMQPDASHDAMQPNSMAHGGMRKNAPGHDAMAHNAMKRDSMSKDAMSQDKMAAPK